MSTTLLTQRQIFQYEEKRRISLASLNSFVGCVNRARAEFWNKPDDELRDFLQGLHDAGELDNYLEDHEKCAAQANQLLELLKSDERCLTGLPRKFSVTFGKVSLKPIPLPEPLFIPEPEPEPEPEKKTIIGKIVDWFKP